MVDDELDETRLHPQVARSRSAVLAAVTKIIEQEGAGQVTHAHVAKTAGVGRATVYRHWPERVDLLTDALAQTSLKFLEPSPGLLIDRVRSELERIAADLNSPGVMAMAATVVERAEWDQPTRQLRDRIVADIRSNLATAVKEAVTDGQLSSEPDVDDLLAQLIGPLWVRRTLQGADITGALIEQVIAGSIEPLLATE